MNLLVKIIGLVSLLLMIGDLSDGKTESRLRVGKSINVFVRYGYLGISMKVISYNDTERWLFKEPTNNVFLVSSSRVCSDSIHSAANRKNHHSNSLQPNVIISATDSAGITKSLLFFKYTIFAFSSTFRNWCETSNVWIMFLLFNSFQCIFFFWILDKHK